MSAAVTGLDTGSIGSLAADIREAAGADTESTGLLAASLGAALDEFNARRALCL